MTTENPDEKKTETPASSPVDTRPPGVLVKNGEVTTQCCQRCLDEKPENQTMREWSRLELRITDGPSINGMNLKELVNLQKGQAMGPIPEPKMLTLWCVRHEIRVRRYMSVPEPRRKPR